MGNTVLITGATGCIGGLLARRIIRFSSGEEVVKELLLLVRDEKKARRLLEPELCDTQIEVRFVECSLEELTADKISGPVDYIIHCAAVTDSSYMISNPVETVDGIVLGTCNILKLAREKQIKSMVYLSSMEVYGVVPDIGRPRREEELGEIPLDSVRSCYPLGKRMAEHYCFLYAKEYGIPVKIARLAQTFGIGTREEDNRVYMQFARAAHEGRDIVLNTQGSSYGNYCSTDDAVNAIFLLLEKGIDGDTYNVVNEENTMCISDMANLVANKIADGRISVRRELKDIAETGYAPDSRLRMSGEKMRRLGWEPVKDLVQMYQDIDLV